jgi:hypothetical protein
MSAPVEPLSQREERNFVVYFEQLDPLFSSKQEKAIEVAVFYIPCKSHCQQQKSNPTTYTCC